MSRPDRKYVRVYCDDLAHDYPAVWEDANLGWTWLRLLDVAEKMWPAVPEVPRWVKPRILARLVELGIVSLVPPHRFRLKGVDKQRAERQAHAKKGAAGRWDAPGNAPGSPVGNAGSESLDETRRDTTISPQPPASGGPPRADGTNPRARAERAAQAAAAEQAHHRTLVRQIRNRYFRGEINEDEERRLLDDLRMAPDDLRRQENRLVAS